MKLGSIGLAAAVLSGLAAPAWSQKAILDASPVLEDFQGFSGAGLSPSPGVGQLDSDEFAGTGMSAGDVAFGGTATSGDWARGQSSSAVVTGGVYAGVEAAERWLFVQPGGGDFTPGTLTIRYVNQTVDEIPSLTVAYQIRVRNDQGRASSWNFSYSTDDVSYTAVPALDFTTPAAADALGWVAAASRFTSLTNLAIAPGAFFYIRFSSADVSGTGLRDEFGVDNIVVGFTDLIFADGFEAGP
jgi:hypothetical protein